MKTRSVPAGRVALTAAFVVLALALVPAALAGKPSGGSAGGGKGGGGHGGSTTTYSGSFVGTNPVLVTDANGNGSPDYGDQVTFNVTSNASYYFVALVCTQNGTTVEQQTNGFYVGWPWSKNYTLTSTAWSGGAASCTATLYASLSDGSNRQNLASVSFGVGA
jgi:hypothetical protein